MKRFPFSRRDLYFSSFSGHFILGGMLAVSVMVAGFNLASAQTEESPTSSEVVSIPETPTMDTTTTEATESASSTLQTAVVIPVPCLAQSDAWSALQWVSTFCSDRLSEENREVFRKLYQESTGFWLKNGRSLKRQYPEWEAFSVGLMLAVAPLLDELDRESRVSNSLAIKRLMKKENAWLPEKLVTAMEQALFHYERGHRNPEAFAQCHLELVRWFSKETSKDSTLFFLGFWSAMTASQAVGEGVSPAMLRSGRLIQERMHDHNHFDASMTPALEAFDRLLVLLDTNAEDTTGILEGVLDVTQQFKTCCRKKHLDL